MFFSKAYLFLKLKYASELHPRIKASPPRGVMAPNQVTPESDSTYSDPEKIKIPSTMHQAEKVIPFQSGLIVAKIPIPSKASVW